MIFFSFLMSLSSIPFFSILNTALIEPCYFDYDILLWHPKLSQYSESHPALGSLSQSESSSNNTYHQWLFRPLIFSSLDHISTWLQNICYQEPYPGCIWIWHLHVKFSIIRFFSIYFNFNCYSDSSGPLFQQESILHVQSYKSESQTSH